MPIRNTHEKTRIESPRADEIPFIDPAHAKHPLDGRKPNGQIAPGNKLAKSRGAKRLLKQPLGGLDADPEMKHDAEMMFTAIMRDMPGDDAEVRALVAAQCRNAVFATKYANLATVAGLTSADGMRWSEKSRSHDLAAQRMALAASELAVRAATLQAARRPPKWGILEIAAEAERERETAVARRPCGGLPGRAFYDSEGRPQAAGPQEEKKRGNNDD
jgi:hypothetical protein